MILLRDKILKSPRWVLDNIKNISLLDGTWRFPKPNIPTPHDEFLEERIFSSQYFDIDMCSDLNSKLPHMLPKPEYFGEYVGNLGISNNTHVCIYDTNGVSAPRVYWMFKIFGHENVSILNGGKKEFLKKISKIN